MGLFVFCSYGKVILKLLNVLSKYIDIVGVGFFFFVEDGIFRYGRREVYSLGRWGGIGVLRWCRDFLYMCKCVYIFLFLLVVYR